MNSGYLTVVFDAPRPCYQSHHKAQAIHNTNMVQDIMGGGARACTPEITWRRPVNAENFVDELDWRGKALRLGVGKGME